MLDLQERVFGGIIAVAIGGAIMFGMWQGHRDNQAKAAQAQAEQHQSAAQIHQADAVKDDQAAADLQHQVQTGAATIVDLQREVARLRKASAQTHTETPKPGANDPVDLPAPVDLAPLVAKQDELIQAQTVQIGTLTAQVLTLTNARDSWRSAASESQAEAVQLRAVVAAQQGLITGALWKGRIQGLAVGAAGGYISGRLK